MVPPTTPRSTNEALFVALMLVSATGLLVRVVVQQEDLATHSTLILRHLTTWTNQSHGLASNTTWTDRNGSLESHSCSRWSVVSVAGPFLPSPPPWPGWCLLVLLDSPPTSPPPPGVVVLDPTWHRHSCTFHLCPLVSWRGEGRRSLGYLYAIQQGAMVVVDLEEGSVLGEEEPVDVTEGLVELIYPAARVWNPYTHMTDLGDRTPPGFPRYWEKGARGGKEALEGHEEQGSDGIQKGLEEQDQDMPKIQGDPDVLTSHMEQIPRHQVGLVQPLGGDPSLRTYHLLALGLKTAAPTWGGALYTRAAFATLLLPKSLDSRRAKVWRGYIGQRILWLLGMHLAFARPWAELVEEMEQEDLLDGREDLLEDLLRLELECEEVGSCLLELWTALQKAGLLDSADLDLVPAWLADLATLGHHLPPLPRRHGKQFAYLIQGGRAATMANLKRKLAVTEESDMFTLTFLEASGHLYYPNSTHLGGRNALLRYALSLERSPGYKYFIFLDEDVVLHTVNQHHWKQAMSRHPWRRFEEFLGTFGPMVGFPQYSNWAQADPRGPVSVTSTADSCINAFHRRTLQFGLPYHETLLEQLSLRYSAVTRFFKMKAVYQAAMFQCNSLRSVNGGNKYHRRGGKKKPKQADTIEKILDAKQLGKPAVRAVLLESIDESVTNNPLTFLLDNLLGNCCINKHKKKAFGQKQLFRGKMGLKDPEGKFGKSFVPEILKFLNPCGTMVRYQAVWWRSPLLEPVVRDIGEEVRGLVDQPC